MNFVKEFQVEVNAQKYAKSVNGKVQVRYEWDSMKNKVVKTYVVKY
jgi:recombinational DNA repair protein RecT